MYLYFFFLSFFFKRVHLLDNCIFLFFSPRHVKNAFGSHALFTKWKTNKQKIMKEEHPPSNLIYFILILVFLFKYFFSCCELFFFPAKDDEFLFVRFKLS